MRKKLKEARRKAGMTQKEVAEYLGITIRSYQRIERGDILGNISHWDALEDLFKVHQRELRLETNRHLSKSEQKDPYENPQK